MSQATPPPPPSAPSTRDRSAADVAAQSVAAVYARALLATAGTNAGDVVGEIDEFISGVLDAYPKFETILGSAAIAASEKSRMLDAIGGTRASKLLLNFLKVLSRHGRLDLLRGVQRAAHEQLDVLQGRVRVEVSTAHALSTEDTKRLTATLKQQLGKEPDLVGTIDPRLIGGIVLRVGDTIFDASIARHLEQVRESMIQRSVHEIQSRRDRFCHSEGN